MGWKVYLVTMIDNISLDRIGTDDAYNLTSLYEQHMDTEESAANDSPFQFGNGKCDYCEATQFGKLSSQFKDSLSFFHFNCRGLSANWESFCNLICDMQLR